MGSSPTRILLRKLSSHIELGIGLLVTERRHRFGIVPSVCGVLLAISTFAACEWSISGLDNQTDGITYRVTSFNIAESFPVQLQITVEIENESTTSQSVTFPDGCVVLVRAYDGGTEPVWDEGRTAACTQALVQVSLAPGESAEFHTGMLSAATILGDSLPNGEYRIVAYLRPGKMVEREAGMVDLAVP